MSDTQPDTGAPEPADDPTPEPDAGPDLAAEVDKWKALARKQEQRAKANADARRELEELKAQSMTDMEKAITAAREEAAAEAAKGFGARLVDAEVKAAAAGRQVDVGALLEGLDRTRFLGDDGNPDTDAITAWLDRLTPPAPTPPVPDTGGGAGPLPKSDGQLTRADLQSMSSEQIDKARRDGRLTDLLSGKG